MKPLLPYLSVALLALSPLRADKPRITSQDQVPRFSYTVSGKVTDIVTSEAAYEKLAPAVRADLEKLISDYEIADRTTLQGALLALVAMDVNDGRFDDALKRIRLARDLEEKPATKLTLGLLPEAYITARRSGEFATEAAFNAAFAKVYADKVSGLPWELVGDNLKSAKASAEIASAGLITGNLESQFQPGVDKTGQVSGEVAHTLVTAHMSYAHFLPLKAERVAVLTAFIAAHKKEKKDVWTTRQIELAPDAKLRPVIVAIWDSGVDLPIFARQQWTNEAETVNGRDDDNNGFVDDVHGIAFDVKSVATPDLLIPLTAEQRAAYPTARNWTKGYLDLQANVDSAEATALKQHLSTLNRADVKPFIESLNLFGNYTHGTHVAGIASAGNPAIRLLVARITFDHRMIPDVPTREQAERDAAAAKSIVTYLKQNHVRVVNMSWGGSPRDIEAAFEVNGAGGTPEERRKTAREYFQLFRVAMTEAMRSAPEILFVCAAGNSNNDAEFDELVPSGIILPNVLTVGAVDQAGEETSFSTFGRNVGVHANGFEVESYLPGGERIKYSGTSMASPNVVNLAAKLLALEPGLTVEQVVGLIKLGAERSADGRINLINPKRSLALLLAMKQG